MLLKGCSWVIQVWLPARSREVKLGQMSITFLSCMHTWMGHKAPVFFLCVVLHSVSFFPVLYLPCISCQTVGAPVWPEQPLEQSRLVCHSNVSDILLCRSCERAIIVKARSRKFAAIWGRCFLFLSFFPFIVLPQLSLLVILWRSHADWSRTA